MKLIWRGIAMAGLGIFTLFGWGEAAVQTPVPPPAQTPPAGDSRQGWGTVNGAAAPVLVAQWWSGRRGCNCTAVYGVRG